MYYYCCLCILIVRPYILNVVYVFLLWSMYSYCSSMYSYCCLCILIVVYVFLDAATLTEVFPCCTYCCFVLFYVLFVCKCVLPPGDNPIAVNKYIISYVPYCVCATLHRTARNLHCIRGTYSYQVPSNRVHILSGVWQCDPTKLWGYRRTSRCAWQGSRLHCC